VNRKEALSRGGALRLLWLFIPAIFVLAALCQLPSQASYADEQPPAGGRDEASLAAALKRLSAVGDQNAESDASAMKAYSALGLASEERPQEKIDQFYARQAIPMDEDVKRSLGADLIRREVEECRRSGKPNDDCLKQAVSKMKGLGRSDILDRLVASIEKSPLETLRGMKPLAMSADPKWPEVKPQRGPTGGGTTSEPAKPAKPTSLTLKGHTKTVENGAFTQDGLILATTSEDSTVRLWNTQTGELLKTLGGYGGSQGQVAFSLDGKLGASSSRVEDSDGRATYSVKAWDGPSGALKQSLANQTGPVAFSPDGNTLATIPLSNGPRGISLWEMQTGALKQTLSQELFVYPYSVRDVIFSPDGNMLIIGTGVQSQSGEVALIDARTGTLQKRLTGHADIVQRVAISPDGKTLASASLDETVILWDLQTGQPKQTLKAGHPVSVSFSPDGQILANGTSSGVRLWNVQTGELKQTVEAQGPVVAIIFLPDGKTVMVAGTSGNDVLLRRVPLN
jgi:WD domain, G-beta repeat